MALLAFEDALQAHDDEATTRALQGLDDDAIRELEQVFAAGLF